MKRGVVRKRKGGEVTTTGSSKVRGGRALHARPSHACSTHTPHPPHLDLPSHPHTRTWQWSRASGQFLRTWYNRNSESPSVATSSGEPRSSLPRVDTAGERGGEAETREGGALASQVFVWVDSPRLYVVVESLRSAASITCPSQPAQPPPSAALSPASVPSRPHHPTPPPPSYTLAPLPVLVHSGGEYSVQMAGSPSTARPTAPSSSP